MNDILINENLTIKEALQKLDETGKQILFTVDSEKKLVGSITDGDIRRWILKNGELSFTVANIMNTKPHYILSSDTSNKDTLFKDFSKRAIPVLDEEGVIEDIIFLNEKDDFINSKKYNRQLDVPVVIMAGGKGTRLKPFTNILPKPLIPIGETPIVERIMNNFSDFGINNFIMSVNYKMDMIKAYFKENSKNYEIEYIVEDEPLGTGGSLSLMKEYLSQDFFVSNCDILINGDYVDMLNYHKNQNNAITLISSMKYHKIPYGVVEINDDGQVSKMKEKPEFDFLINTGMYILNHECLNYIPDNQFYHITDLIEYCITNDIRVGVYPVSSNHWLDMGQFDEMERMLEKLGIDKDE